jgi:hypothetical protein
MRRRCGSGAGAASSAAAAGLAPPASAPLHVRCTGLRNRQVRQVGGCAELVVGLLAAAAQALSPGGGDGRGGGRGGGGGGSSRGGGGRGWLFLLGAGQQRGVRQQILKAARRGGVWGAAEEAGVERSLACSCLEQWYTTLHARRAAGHPLERHQAHVQRAVPQPVEGVVLQHLQRGRHVERQGAAGVAAVLRVPVLPAGAQHLDCRGERGRGAGRRQHGVSGLGVVAATWLQAAGMGSERCAALSGWRSSSRASPSRSRALSTVTVHLVSAGTSTSGAVPLICSWTCTRVGQPCSRYWFIT